MHTILAFALLRCSPNYVEKCVALGSYFSSSALPVMFALSLAVPTVCSVFVAADICWTFRLSMCIASSYRANKPLSQGSFAIVAFLDTVVPRGTPPVVQPPNWKCCSIVPTCFPQEAFWGPERPCAAFPAFRRPSKGQKTLLPVFHWKLEMMFFVLRRPAENQESHTWFLGPPESLWGEAASP